MGLWDVKRRRRPPRLLELGLLVMLLHLFLGSGNFVRAIPTNYYWETDTALQAIWGNWNRSTPDLESNLAGWTSSETNDTSMYPCQSLSNADATFPNWLGVFCLKTNYNATTGDSEIEIVGLTLQNASIVGTLPPAIGNLSYLTTLQLTGNPNLTGPLPDTLGDMWLNILDLHDNGFDGPLPAGAWNILQLDVSGNQLEGGYPFNQTSTMHYLQVLSIGGNNFEGEIQADAFENKTELQQLDISDNKFFGLLPNLTRMYKYLNYLDVSGNQFAGPLPDLTSFESLRYVNLGRNKFDGMVNLPAILNLQNPNVSLVFVGLSHNNLQGPLPSWDASNLGPIQELYLQNNQFDTGNTHLLDFLSNVVKTSPALTTLNLSSNRLAGPLSSWNNSATSLGSIQELYLDNNSLSGTLDISKMSAWGLLEERLSFGSAPNPARGRLTIMSLRNNNISHINTDPSTMTKTTTVIILDGNPYCDIYDSKDEAQRFLCTQYRYVTPDTSQSDHRPTAIIATVSSVVAVVSIVLVIVAALLYKNKRYKQYLQLQFEKKFEEFDVKPTIFPYNDLKAATRDFHEDMKLGQGGYGAVYKGVLPNGNVVAVKQLFVRTAQGMDEFLNEVVLITGMKHRNLVNLKGCCLRENQRLLVYEYVDNYDVDQVLLGSRKEVVSWHVRLKICVGIARGLHYLHSLAHPRVIHRDIKASNILLDKNLEPKIADFGLALLFPDEQTHIMTVHVGGTRGYLAPEYASLGQLSDKVDVYSFGVLCLEIISGRRNIDDTKPLDQVYLSQWAWQLHEEDRLLELVDPSLQLADEERRDVERVINVFLLSIQHAAEKRPTMARVVHILHGDNESDVQVLRLGRGERPSFESLMSQRAVDHPRSTGLESVMEEGMSSNGSHAGPFLARDSLGSGVVELSEFGGR